MHGKPYMWEADNEPHAYRLEASEVERLRDATRAVHEIALAVAERAAGDEEALDILAIPSDYRDLVAESWRRGDAGLYQRMDLVPGLDGELKLLEYNADTPTGLVEMHCYLVWLEDAVALDLLPAGAEQFNDVRCALTERLDAVAIEGILHVSAARGLTEEIDTVRLIAECAEDVGVATRFAYLDEIGIDAADNLADGEDYVIENLFKLFPWEDIAAGPFSAPVRRNRTCRWFEPAWKMMWSNKAFLVLAWRLFPGHPNLLPAYFEDDAQAGSLERYVRKPQWGREGQNTTVVDRGEVLEGNRGEYADNRMVIQAYAPPASYGGRHPVLGSWVVGEEPVGLLIREDAARITANLSVCAPHFHLA